MKGNLIYRGNIEILKYCTKEAEAILKDPDFLGYLIEQVVEFKFTVVDDLYIADQIEKYARSIEVKTYFSRLRVNAYFSNTDPNSIYMNSNKLKRYSDTTRNCASIIHTLVHEVIHVIDFWDKAASYGHRSNTRVGKTLAAPNLVGAIAEKYWLESRGRTVPQIKARKVRLSYWTMFKNWIRRIF